MPMPPNANATFEEATTIVNASLAQALANPLFAPQAKPLVTEMGIPDTKLNFRFLLDNRGLTELTKNIEKKAAVQKELVILSAEFTDNVTVALRDLKSSHGDMYRMAGEGMGAGLGPWQDQKVAALLKSGGAGFTTASFDGEPYFSGSHPMDLAGEDISDVSNYDSGGAADLWYLFDTRRMTPVWLNWAERPKNIDLGPDSEHAKKAFEVMWTLYCDAGFGMTIWHYGYASNQTLTEAHFNSARVAMEATPTYANSSEGNQVMGVMPNLLVVGRSNRLAAEKLINSATIDGGDPNPLYKTTGLLVLSYLP